MLAAKIRVQGITDGAKGSLELQRIDFGFAEIST
jgi:hypothetical protein